MLPLIMGGGILASSALSTVGGLIQQQGAADAQAGALGQLDLARVDNSMNSQAMQALFAPYQLYGSSALGFLQDRILNSTERKMSVIQQRNQLKADVERLRNPIDWTTVPIQTGEKASERRQSMWMEMEFNRKQQFAAAQAKIDAFDAEQQALAPYQAEQDAYLNNRQNRVDAALNKLTAVSNFSIPTSLAGIREEMMNDPVYNFRLQEGERSINRAAAARGQYFSGAAMGTLADFNTKLTGDETDRYLQRLITGKQAEMQAATTALNAEMGVSQQDISNMMGLANMGLQASQSQAQVGMNANQVNANLYGQAAQTMAQTEMAKANAQAGIYSGAANTIGQATGLMSMAAMMNPGGMNMGSNMFGGQSKAALNQLTYGGGVQR